MCASCFIVTNLVAVQHVGFARSNCRARRIEQHLHDHSQNATPRESATGAFLLKFQKKPTFFKPILCFITTHFSRLPLCLYPAQVQRIICSRLPTHLTNNIRQRPFSSSTHGGVFTGRGGEMWLIYHLPKLFFTFFTFFLTLEP